MTPDDEAWEAFYVNPDAVTFTRAEVRAAFMAGRVSGRADAAAQALEDAADELDSARRYRATHPHIRFRTATSPDYQRGFNECDENTAEILRERAAQYREKGDTR